MGDVRRRGGAVQVRLAPEESAVLESLARQVRNLLTPNGTPAGVPVSADPLELMVNVTSEQVSAPDDPAVRRLLPDAYGDDDASAAASSAEFRRLMDTDLRRLKSDALDGLIAAVSPEDRTAGVVLRLEPDVVEGWLQALNDIRLVVGSRLDVTEDMAERLEGLDPEDPRVPLLLAYDWLGWLQESLVHALD